VKAALNGLPQRVAGRLKDNAAAYHLGVIGQVGAANDIQIPLRVVLRAWSDALFRHAKSIRLLVSDRSLARRGERINTAAIARRNSDCNCSSNSSARASPIRSAA